MCLFLSWRTLPCIRKHSLTTPEVLETASAKNCICNRVHIDDVGLILEFLAESSSQKKANLEVNVSCSLTRTPWSGLLLTSFPKRWPKHRSLGNGVRKNCMRNRVPYRRCGVDTGNAGIWGWKVPNSRFTLHSKRPSLIHGLCAVFAFTSRLMSLLRPLLTPVSTAPFFASLSFHGLHFTVHAPSKFCWVLQVRVASGADSEFLYRVRIVDWGVDCREPVCRHCFPIPEAHTHLNEAGGNSPP